MQHFQWQWAADVDFIGVLLLIVLVLPNVLRHAKLNLQQAMLLCRSSSPVDTTAFPFSASSRRPSTPTG